MLIALSLPWSYISAFKFKFGEFQEDSTRVTGYHYEIEYDSSTDKATAKKVEETEGGGEFLMNILLYLLRILIILFLGFILWGIQTIKILKTAE